MSLLSGTPLASWVIQPNSWCGLHRVAAALPGLPLSLCVFVSSLVIARFLRDLSEYPDSTAAEPEGASPGPVLVLLGFVLGILFLYFVVRGLG